MSYASPTSQGRQAPKAPPLAKLLEPEVSPAARTQADAAAAAPEVTPTPVVMRPSMPDGVGAERALDVSSLASVGYPERVRLTYPSAGNTTGCTTGCTTPSSRSVLSLCSDAELAEALCIRAANMPDPLSGHVRVPPPMSLLPLCRLEVHDGIVCGAIAFSDPFHVFSGLSSAVNSARTSLVQLSDCAAAAVDNANVPKAAQVATVSAAGCGVALGVAGAAGGAVTGGTVGALLGLVAAPLTLGLSVPLGAAAGSGTGFCAGAAVGGTAGTVGGGIVGLVGWRLRNVPRALLGGLREVPELQPSEC